MKITFFSVTAASLPDFNDLYVRLYINVQLSGFCSPWTFLALSWHKADSWLGNCPSFTGSLNSWHQRSSVLHRPGQQPMELIQLHGCRYWLSSILSIDSIAGFISTLMPTDPSCPLVNTKSTSETSFLIGYVVFSETDFGDLGLIFSSFGLILQRMWAFRSFRLGGVDRAMCAGWFGRWHLWLWFRHFIFQLVTWWFLSLNGQPFSWGLYPSFDLSPIFPSPFSIGLSSSPEENWHFSTGGLNFDFDTDFRSVLTEQSTPSSWTVLPFQRRATTIAAAGWLEQFIEQWK